MTRIILLISFLFLFNLADAQWQQSTGTDNLNYQSLHNRSGYDFAGGATGAYLSTNESASYNSSNSGNDASGPTRGITSDANYVYTCTSQGVFRSDNNGSSWVSKSNGLGNLLNSGILHVNGKLFVATPTGVFKSIDQANTWSAGGMIGIDVRCLTAINDTVFAGTNGSGIYKTIDGGINWVAVNNGLNSTNVRAIEAKGNTIFAGGQIGTGVFRSTNGGASWTLLSGGLPSGSYRGFAQNNQLIVAGAFGAGVFYSLDNGDTWTAINNGLADLTIFDLEINNNFIIAATNTKGIFRFALSNLIIQPNVDPIFTQLSPICKDESFTLPATSNNGINGSWTPVNNNQTTTTYTFTPVVGSNANTTTMTVLILQPSVNTISIDTTAAFDWNGMTYTTSGNYSWTGINAAGCDSIVTLHLTIVGSSISDTAIVYPNPSANGLIKINLGKFNVSNIQEKGIQLLVYDAGGRLCINKTLVDNITAINLNQLSKGIYFIKIISLDSSINYCTRICRG
jgi:hypothetical protein